jgi:hypothetical protein
VIAVDTVGAGPGELVLILDEGTSARQIVGETNGGPLRTVIVGIVDEVAGPASVAKASNAKAAKPRARRVRPTAPSG